LAVVYGELFSDDTPVFYINKGLSIAMIIHINICMQSVAIITNVCEFDSLF